MATIELLMPKMGESVMEGTILSWLKEVGEEIEEEESVLEVATDKVDTEIPSTHAGVLKEILVKEGDVVPVGSPIARIEIDGEATDAPSPTPHTEEVAEAEKLMDSAMSTASSQAAVADLPKVSDSDKFYSPLVKSIAKAEGISSQELDTITGTGKEGRVTKTDILAFVAQRQSAAAPSQATSTPARKPVEPMPVSISGEDEIIEMDRMRKMIAERMIASKQISPHVTSFVEADVTAMVKWRNTAKRTYKEKYNTILTFTPIMIEAVVKAIKDFPMVNIQVDGDKIIKKGQVNIGMATALPTGNLIVPVIHDADKLNLVGLTQKVNDLATRARDNKLKPDELSNGTYTVSNVGSFGNVMGTPIIMQPQVGILALGAIQKKPAVIETPEGDLIGIRHKMFLSHSYDHRVVDGALGGMFVRRVADYLEAFDTAREV